MKKGSIMMAILVSAAMLLPFDVRAEGDNSVGGFKDVSDRHWAKATIDQAVRKGYVSGYQDGTFKPDTNITRAEVASILDRVTKLKVGANPIVLPDMDKHWSKESVRRLISMGVISAADYSKGFEPNKPITRYELMKWMASGLAQSDSTMAQALKDTKDTLLPTPESFTGAIVKEQVPYIALVRGTGIVNGYADGSFKPKEKATRAEVLTMILKYAVVEGTKADQYHDLQEMIGVALEGTNMRQITDIQYGKQSIMFKEFSKKTISVPSADLVIHKMIFVDARTTEYKGVYAKLFTSGKNNEPGNYNIFYEATMTLKRDLFDVATQLRIMGDINKHGNLFSLFTFPVKVIEKNIIPMIPRNQSAEEVVKKGVPYTFWVPNHIKDENETYKALTFKDYEFTIGIYWRDK